MLKKYRDLAVDHYESLESTLLLYDDQEKGTITIDDLREGMASAEIYDGRDKKSFECFAIYLLRKNNKNTENIKIVDVL
jgi:hypothetical protein